MNANDQIRKYYRFACADARKELIRLAREVLQKHPAATEFVMAMGHAFFVMKDGSYKSTSDHPLYMRKVFGLLDEWDPYLKLTGDPVRFKAEGDEVTEW